MQIHKATIQIRFADIDVLGHVNNAKYFTYFEQARIAMLDEFLGEDIRYDEGGVILASAKIDFKIPVRFKDKVIVESTVSRLGNKSFDIASRMLIEKDGALLEAATGLVVLVSFDYIKNQSVEIPKSWREKMEAIM